MDIGMISVFNSLIDKILTHGIHSCTLGRDAVKIDCNIPICLWRKNYLEFKPFLIIIFEENLKSNFLNGRLSY